MPPISPDTALTESLEVGPDIDAESWRLRVPGRAACYVLEDADRRPIIAATVGDLRGALMRRLGPDAVDEADETTRSGGRKIDYRAVTRRVRYRPVYSRFEGNWCYLENVRSLFPKNYRRLIRSWRAYWVSVDPAAKHPRFVSCDRPAGQSFGPFATNKSARRHVEMLEDVFDLCRYHNILTQAPEGEACAYKQMGRCPAPCDGTITMDAYRTQIDAGLAFMSGGPQQWQADTTQQMTTAAADRDYEHAARLKAKLDAAGAADAPQTELVRSLDVFRFVSLQAGDRKGRTRIYLIGAGSIEYAGQIDKTNRDELIPQIAARIQTLSDAPTIAPAEAGTQRIGLVAWHLMSGQRERGVFTRAAYLPDADALGRALDAFAATQTKRPAKPDVDDVSSETDATPTG